MKQEPQELLLKDICARLPYGIKASYYGVEEECETWDEIEGITLDEDFGGYVDIGQYSLPIERIKPYLFPLSSMTDEQWKELRNLIYEYFALDEEFNEGICYKTYGDILVWLDEKPINECYFIFDYLNKNHFDYRGLIPMGLAIDATGLNIY